MVVPSQELPARLLLVRRALELSPEPLHAPLGLVFRPASGADHMEAWAAHAKRAAEGAAFAPATLYVHVPFCARVCTYCLLSAMRTPGKAAVEAYVGALRRQIAMFEPLVRGLRFGSIHVGGGTPTLLDAAQLDALFTDLSRLPRAEHAQIGVEAHPATSTPDRLAVLRDHGVHRLSFGVESMTPAVLERVNRADQTEGRVRAAIAEARRLGFGVNVDLLAGLPGESAESWLETVDKTIELEPDSISVNRFLGENSALAAEGYDPTAELRERADAMLLAADARIRERRPPRWPERPLERAAFGTQYVWHASDTARPYFQDDMIGPVSTLALGHGSLGHVHGRSFDVAAGSVEAWVAKLSRGEPPDTLVCRVDERFEQAFFIAEHACRGDLTADRFRRVFSSDMSRSFPAELAFLVSSGLLRVEGDTWRKPARRDFQMTHLLAFLLRASADLAREVRQLEGATLAGVAPEDDPRRALRDYDLTAEEMPPSMLWVRIAVRAAQASRGAQRLIQPRSRSAAATGVTERG